MFNDKNENATKNFDYDCAHLTAYDIKCCREQLKDIIIAPFDPAKAKGVGYNFSLSEMIYSINRKRLVPICRDTHETYFYLRSHETVLALSYEYLKVDKSIAGSFHSRVRITAQGVGSISTTLDPEWKGMLLFSLNNPTNKRIKIVLSTRSDGLIKNQAVLTLVAWRTQAKPKEINSEESFTLHLDNPPMRIDIWSELASKPLRLFRNRDYQIFSNLINSLSPFESKASPNVLWANDLITMLTTLRVAIEAKKSESEIRAALIQIEAIKELPTSVKNRLDVLTKALQEKNILKATSEIQYLESLNLADREIQYQLLCDQINQIHELINKKVPTFWRKSLLANLCNAITKNIGILISTLVATVVIIYGKHTGDPNYWPQVIIATIPLVVSILYHFIVERKNK